MQCKNSHLDKAPELTNKFNLTLEDARAYQNVILRYGCKTGKLEELRWFVKQFKLTAKDIHLDDMAHVLCLACTEGHLRIVQWLIQTFKPTMTIMDTKWALGCARRQGAFVRRRIDFKKSTM